MGDKEGQGAMSRLPDPPRVPEASVLPGQGAASSAEHAALTRRWHHRVLIWCAHRWFLLARGMTLGVRAAVLDGEGRVFLVRHTYVPGWHLPGGGVEVGQTLKQALADELSQEGNITLSGEPLLHGMFLNLSASRRDHVAVFVVRNFEVNGLRRPDREIAEAGFFPADGLPAGTTRGTRARLREILEGVPITPHW